MPKFYIATSIPYVNAPPHIGHALEFVQADVIARYRRLKGDNVFLATGTDENSLKNALSAEKLGMKTEDLCQRNSALFRDLVDSINMSYDTFVRTSLKGDHWKMTQILWDACNSSGDIYKKKYSGLYCVGCELFYAEGELDGGLCPEHRTKPERVEEENYFFRLSKYQDRLIAAIEKDEIRIIPSSRKAEVVNFMKGGLEDFSVSRSVNRAHGWGIPVPGDPSQILYVWFDALGYYLTAAGIASDRKAFNEMWPIDMHVIGKGIVRFHAIYWPAMLMSGGFEVPRSILVHGYITVEGEKMSKSIGNVVDPMDVIRKYGTDPVRYYLMKEISTFQDGDFSDRTLKDVINNELVGNLGNFVNRTLTFIYSKLGGKVEKQKLGDEDMELVGQITGLVGEVEKMLEAEQLNVALLKILEISNLGNRYFQNSEPWKLIKEDEAKAKKVLFICANICRILGILTYPYMPSSAERLLGYIHETPSSFEEAKKLSNEFKVEKPEILFSRAE